MRRQILLVCILLSNEIFAGTTEDPASSAGGESNAQVMQQTQNLLRDKNQVDAILSQTPQGRKGQQSIQILMGSHSPELYDAAADIFPELVKMSNGDPAKMQQILEQALKNPEALNLGP